MVHYEPKDAAELAALLADAARQRVPVWPCGAGTYGDGLERADGWAISLAKLARVIDHQPDDLTLTAQAGLALGAAQAQLGGARQYLPHRAAGGDAATLGGLLATHRPGLTRLGHGPLRDRVLGMTVALSTGEVAKSGGRVVKNVAGYDLHRLHVGARGTLGVIVEVTLKVSPLPAGRTLLMAPLARLDAAGPFARELARSPLVPVAVLASERIAGRGPGGEPLEGAWLWIQLEDVEAGRERAVRDARRLALAHGLGELVRHESAELPRELADLAAAGGGEVPALLRLGAPGSRGAALAEQARGSGALVADLGEGLVQCRLDGDAAQASRVARQLAAHAREHGGWAQLVRAPAAVWRDLSATPAPQAGRVPAAEQMEALRAALDPAGVMSPGRMLAGVL